MGVRCLSRGYRQGVPALDMDRKICNFTHGFPKVLAQSGMGEYKILEFVTFELAGYGISHQG